MQVAQGNLPEALTSNQASCCRILSVDGKQIVGYREPTKPMTAERTQRLAISAREIVTETIGRFSDLATLSIRLTRRRFSLHRCRPQSKYC